MRRRRRVVASGLAFAGLVVAAGGSVTAVLAPGSRGESVSASAADAGMAWLLLAAAGSLVLAGITAWVARPGSGLAVIAFWAAAASLAPELVGSATVSREIRSLGLLLAPFALPLLVHLPLRALRADGARLRLVIVALYASTAALAVGHALTWSAYLVVDCAPSCRRDDNVLGVLVDIRASLWLRSAGWWLTAAGGVALAGWASWRLIRDRGGARSEGRVLVPALVTGLALAAWAEARLTVPMPSPADPWSMRTTGLLALAVVSLGLGVAWVRSSEGRRAARVRGLVEFLDAGAGSRSLEATLGTILRDPSIRVVYATDDGAGFVDGQGMPIAPLVPSRSRAVTPVERDGVRVALVEHDAGLDPDLLSREVGAAARLAMDNERLAALLRVQVRELQASRERIVAAGDSARGRLERDLHDGAQQRLLAVSYELRLAQAAVRASRAGEPGDPKVTAQAAAAPAAAIDAAVQEIDLAIAELRQLAHGIWPAVLAEAGLEAALASLADEAPIPVTMSGIPDARYPAPVESAAYFAVTEALRRAASGVAAGLAVSATAAGSALVVTARADGLRDPGPWLQIDDRVGAAGGRSMVALDGSGTLLTVELPCG